VYSGKVSELHSIALIVSPQQSTFMIRDTFRGSSFLAPLRVGQANQLTERPIYSIEHRAFHHHRASFSLLRNGENEPGRSIGDSS
jgi:hypothetical protein